MAQAYHIQSRWFSSLRYRLLTLALVPLLLLAVTVVVFAAQWTTNFTYEQLFTKVNTDLRVAHDSFQRIQSEQEETILTLASSKEIVSYWQNPTELVKWVDVQRELNEYNYLILLSQDGEQRLGQGGWLPHTMHASPLTQSALSNGVTPGGGTGIEIVPVEVWLSNGLLEPGKVVFPLIDTPRAAPSDRSAEDRAMLIRSVHAVIDENGDRIALLEGGRLLNRDFDFVDRIRDLVYGPGSLAPGSLGTVTVFLDDVRITTNVPSSDATRALGTRVSEEVRNTVLQLGEQWIDRAFVVNDWYISAYEPIIDVNDERVGMLYAGYLEKPFRQELFNAIAVLSALVLAGCLFAICAAMLGARSIFRPIERLTSVVRATAAGKSTRVGAVESVDEIGELAAQFDGMLDTLEVQRRKIEQGAQLLEDKVQLRTTELRQQNQRLTDSLTLLKQTRQQLETAERLAALGELTAGVAHEINNPTAVILGNMDILISEIGEDREDVATEIDLIIQQVYRIRSITHRLVQYSRSENDQLSPSAQTVSLPDLVSNTVRLIQHDFLDDSLVITEQHDCTQDALVDPDEMQQVLVNLVRNAVEAINQTSVKGRIVIATKDLDDKEVCIEVTDNGAGIEPTHIARLFDPFFTSGKELGTGLGLSVSFGIVRRHGGRIDVTSTLGAGSTFTVVLPVAASAPYVASNSPSVKAAPIFDTEDVLSEFKR